MASFFDSISDVKVDLPNRSASFSFEEVKIAIHDNLMEVEQSFNSLFHYFQAIDQLDAVVKSIQSADGEVNPSIMQLVNQNNQLGKLFSIYIPPALRFEMADSPIDAMNKQANGETTAAPKNITTSAATSVTPEEKKEVGSTLTDKAKEASKKMWEVMKAFFEKILQSLKSFWQWIRNGFISNFELNTKLAALIQADVTGDLTSAALSKASGYLSADQAKNFVPVTSKILNAPFLKLLDSTKCSDVMKQMDATNVWNMDSTGLLGISEADLKASWILFTPASGNTLLPSLSQDSETLKSLKAHKRTLDQLNWSKESILNIITELNAFYQSVKSIDVPKFISEEPRYDWENAEYISRSKDVKLARNRIQAVPKFYSQLCKIFVICGEVPQSHLTAINKFMKSAPATAAQTQPTASVQPVA